METGLVGETQHRRLQSLHYFSFIKSRQDKEPRCSWDVDSGRLEPLQATVILISSPAVLGLPCPPRRGRRRVRSPSRSQPSQSARPHPEPPGTTRSYAPRAAGAETSARLIDGTPSPPPKHLQFPLAGSGRSPDAGSVLNLAGRQWRGWGGGSVSGSSQRAGPSVYIWEALRAECPDPLSLEG